MSDVNPLVDLTNLQQLYLRYNDIVDIGPLLNNTGLGMGDVLGLDFNPLSQQSILEFIPTLVARGMTVTF